MSIWTYRGLVLRGLIVLVRLACNEGAGAGVAAANFMNDAAKFVAAVEGQGRQA